VHDRAEVAELADALRSGRSGREPVGVRVSPSAPSDLPAAPPITGDPRPGQPGGPDTATTPPPPNLDLAVLAHLRGYPEELRRFSNLLKQVHPHGRSAVEYFLSREVAADSFLAALCRLVQAGEDLVTVVEAADLLGTRPARVMELAESPSFPRPLWGEGRQRVWRRADIADRPASG